VLRRAVWLALAVVLAFPSLSTGWIVLTSTAFLAEFLSGGRLRPLSAIAPGVSVAPLPVVDDGRSVPADLYVGAGLRVRPGLVLVHGLSPLGKDDPRVREAADLLARAGFAVAVPTIAGLTVLRLRPGDAGAVTATVRSLARRTGRPVAVLGVSLGAGPALLAAADPGVASRLSALLLLGGYASAVELLRYTLTGDWAFEGVTGRRPVDPAAIARFAAANAELVDGAGGRLLANRDPGAFDHLVAELAPETRRLLAQLSPERAVGRIGVPIVLVHGRDDPAVPFTESMRLERTARAAGDAVRLVIVGSLAHVEPESRAGPSDLARLWAAFYAFRVSAAGITGGSVISGGRDS